MTVVGNTSKQDFEKRFDEMFTGDMRGVYKVVVIVDRIKDRIVGSGTILMEKKFIRQTGTVSITDCFNLLPM